MSAFCCIDVRHCAFGSSGSSDAYYSNEAVLNWCSMHFNAICSMHFLRPLVEYVPSTDSWQCPTNQISWATASEAWRAWRVNGDMINRKHKATRKDWDFYGFLGRMASFRMETSVQILWFGLLLSPEMPWTHMNSETLWLYALKLRNGKKSKTPLIQEQKMGLSHLGDWDQGKVRHQNAGPKPQSLGLTNVFLDQKMRES